MSIEIERKFLVETDGWKAAVVESHRLRDGLVAYTVLGKVRVRIGSNRATITIKGNRRGRRRTEFEYEIPVTDAEEMLAKICQGPVLEKIRHIVRYEDLVWEVDVYEGLLEGVIIAEVELESENQQISLPPWLGSEVTDDAEFSKSALIQRLIGKVGLLQN